MVLTANHFNLPCYLLKEELYGIQMQIQGIVILQDPSQDTVLWEVGSIQITLKAVTFLQLIRGIGFYCATPSRPL